MADQEILDGKTTGILRQLYTQSLRQSAVLLSTLLNRKMQINLTQIQVVSSGQLNLKYSQPSLILKFKMNNGVGGGAAIGIFPQNLSLVLINILKGPEAKNLSLQIDLNGINLLSQLFTEFLKSLAASFSQSLNKKINFATLDLKLSTFGQESLSLFNPSQQIVSLVSKVSLESIADEYEFIQVIPLNVIKEVFGIASESDAKIQPLTLSALDKSTAVNLSQDLNKILLDIPLQLSVELGRTKMLLKDVLELGAGSIIELDHLAGEPADIMLNNKLLAKGEIVVIDDNLGVRLTQIVNPNERL